MKALLKKISVIGIGVMIASMSIINANEDKPTLGARVKNSLRNFGANIREKAKKAKERIQNFGRKIKEKISSFSSLKEVQKSGANEVSSKPYEPESQLSNIPTPPPLPQQPTNVSYKPTVVTEAMPLSQNSIKTRESQNNGFMPPPPPPLPPSGPIKAQRIKPSENRAAVNKPKPSSSKPSASSPQVSLDALAQARGRLRKPAAIEKKSPQPQNSLENRADYLKEKLQKRREALKETLNENEDETDSADWQ